MPFACLMYVRLIGSYEPIILLLVDYTSSFFILKVVITLKEVEECEIRIYRYTHSHGSYFYINDKLYIVNTIAFFKEN